MPGKHQVRGGIDPVGIVGQQYTIAVWRWMIGIEPLGIRLAIEVFVDPGDIQHSAVYRQMHGPVDDHFTPCPGHHALQLLQPKGPCPGVVVTNDAIAAQGRAKVAQCFEEAHRPLNGIAVIASQQQHVGTGVPELGNKGFKIRPRRAFHDMQVADKQRLQALHKSRRAVDYRFGNDRIQMASAGYVTVRLGKELGQASGSA